jgi:CRISPR-associated RAMP protein (TIGR02581 family)
MQKRLLNQCLIDLEITTEGPLLIKSGLPGITGPDMSPVVTFRSGTRPQPYIPGSSLKGVLRSHAERIARTLCWEPEEWRVGACNPFLTKRQETDWDRQGFCGAKFEELKKRAQTARSTVEALTTPVIYRDSCPACKVFGSTFLIGRLSVPDLYLKKDSAYHTERRDGVGIDRFTGGSSPNALFNLEVVTNAVFETHETQQLRLINFELWQLGWLAYVLRDLSEGLISIGSGKSRGLGQVSAEVRKVELSTASRCLPQRNTARLWELAVLETDEARSAYGYWRSAAESVPLESAQTLDDALGLCTCYCLEGTAAVTGLWRQVAPIATQYFEQHYQTPPTMRFDGRTAADEE